MNTPSKEALEAANQIECLNFFAHNSVPCTPESIVARIIDRHFEPLRRDNATLAGRLTAAELERDSLGARAEQAEALLRETEAVAAQGATQYAELNRKFAELPDLRAANAELAGALRALSQAVHAKIQVQGADGNYVLSMYVASADRILARHASGEPAQEACGGRCGDPYCNLSTEGELMREPAKHPDAVRMEWLEDFFARFTERSVLRRNFAANLRQVGFRAAIDMARQEVKP